jgi:hypothetical protein
MSQVSSGSRRQPLRRRSSRAPYRFYLLSFVPGVDCLVTAGEAVGVFGVIESPGSFVLATRLGFEGGDTFTPLGDEIADDLG